MPIDSTNYDREIKNLRAEISELRAEVAFMYSAFQDVQEQFGFALTEISNSIKTLNGEIKENLEKNQNSMQDENFQNILGLSKKLDETKKGLTENFNQSLLKLQTEQKNFFVNNFSQLEKISDAQQINFGNHFDAIENSVAAQQKMFAEIVSQKNSEVIEKISVVQKNLAKFSSEVDEILSDNQKDLMKKIDSVNDKLKDFYKTLNAIEELLRLIAANQLLNEVQNNLPQKNNSSQKSLPNVHSDRNKSISIYGRSGVGKTTLAIILKNQYSQFEILEISGVDKYEIKRDYIERDLAIFVIGAGYPDYTETKNFAKICEIAQKVLLVVNARLNYALEVDPFIRARQVINFMNDTPYIQKNIYDMFRSRCPYSTDWNKVSVMYVHLKAAQIASQYPRDRALLTASNFTEIEKFINEL